MKKWPSSCSATRSRCLCFSAVVARSVKPSVARSNARNIRSVLMMAFSWIEIMLARSTTVSSSAGLRLAVISEIWPRSRSFQSTRPSFLRPRKLLSSAPRSPLLGRRKLIFTEKRRSMASSISTEASSKLEATTQITPAPLSLLTPSSRPSRVLAVSSSHFFSPRPRGMKRVCASSRKMMQLPRAQALRYRAFSALEPPPT